MLILGFYFCAAVTIAWLWLLFDVIMDFYSLSLKDSFFASNLQHTNDFFIDVQVEWKFNICGDGVI
jgi:hypothetical protein